MIEQGIDPDTLPIFANKPELFGDLVWVWEAYLTLSAGRQHGMAGPQPISLVELLAYCSFRGITDPDERDELLHLVQHLDGVYTSHMASKSKGGAKPPPSS